MHLSLNDIGDGLFLEIFDDKHRLITDFGSQQQIAAEDLYVFYDQGDGFARTDFALSHFHKDHYSGLVEIMLRDWQTNFNTVYIPRLPRQDEAISLFYALETIFAFSMGGYSGSMDYDFVSLMSQINSTGFSLVPLSQGDSFTINGKPFTVSWPPKNFSNDVLARIGKVIVEFEEEAELIPELKELYRKIQNSDKMWIYYEGSQLQADKEKREAFKIKRKPPVLTNEQRSIFRRLNTKLRNAANCVSLCYYNEFVNFMGDLESAEIAQCLRYIYTSRKHMGWPILILPHHGTHWHDDMRSIAALYGLSSNGKKMARHWEKNNRSICHYNLTTLIDGTIDL